MKYFTKELLKQFQSDDNAIADKANDDWESAIESYQLRLSEMQADFSSTLKVLGEYCFHDSEIIGISVDSEKHTVEVALSLDSSFNAGPPLVTLRFLGVFKRYPVNPPRSKLYWLYEEIDITDQGFFKYSILMEDVEKRDTIELGLEFSQLEIIVPVLGELSKLFVVR